jgi:hypothetical protein
MENQSVGQSWMGIDCKGSQDRTERVVVLQEEEDVPQCTYGGAGGEEVAFLYIHDLGSRWR